MTKLANRARFRCIRVRCKIEAMISKFSRALSQRYENGLTCSAYRSTSKSSTVNIIGSAAAYATNTPRHTALASAKRVFADGWQKQRGERSAGQETNYHSINNKKNAQISRNRREKIALSMWDDSAVRSVVFLWKRNPTLRNTDMMKLYIRP